MVGIYRSHVVGHHRGQQLQAQSLTFSSQRLLRTLSCSCSKHACTINYTTVFYCLGYRQDFVIRPYHHPPSNALLTLLFSAVNHVTIFSPFGELPGKLDIAKPHVLCPLLFPSRRQLSPQYTDRPILLWRLNRP